MHLTAFHQSAIGKLLVPLGICLALSISGAAQAGPMTMAFTGVVTQAPYFDPGDPLEALILTGTPFAGSYTFNSEAVDGASDDQTGSYDSIGFPYSLSVAFGSPTVFSVMFREINIGVGNDLGGADYYTFATPLIAPDSALSASLILIDDEGAIFSNDDLPLGALPLDAFESRQFSLSGVFVHDDGSATQVDIHGRIDSLVAVPEPGSLLLLGSGLAALLMLRGRSALTTTGLFPKKRKEARS